MKANTLQMSRTSFSLLLLVLCSFASQAQKHVLPSVKLINSRGIHVDAATIHSTGSPILMVFWKLTDKSSAENLKNMYQVMQDSLLEQKVRLIAICSDNATASYQVKPWLDAQELDLEFYYDMNGDFQRAMGVKPPFSILFDNNMKVHCQQAGYFSGNGSVLCAKIRECVQNIQP